MYVKSRWMPTFASPGARAGWCGSSQCQFSPPDLLGAGAPNQVEHHVCLGLGQVIRCAWLEGRLKAASDFPLFRTPVIYSLSSSHFGPSVLRSSYPFAKGKPLDPRPPAAALGDAQLSQTLKGLSAREREVSPSPFIPTRRVIVRHSPCTPWQPIRLGPKRGLPSLDSPRQGSLAVYSCTLSGVSDGFKMRGNKGQQTVH
jgi:hypothetical protein